MVETRRDTQERLILAVRPRGKPVKRLPEEITVASNGSTSEVYEQLASSSGLSIHRLRITKGSDGSFIPNSKDILVQSTGLRQQSTIYVKDLGMSNHRLVLLNRDRSSIGQIWKCLAHNQTLTGPQIAWQTVFLVEYLGPLLIHPILYAILPSPKPSQLQTLTFILVMIHFAKRELETLFIHRFSAATMPAFNIFRNSAHYWLLSGLNMAYWIYIPTAAAAGESNSYVTFIGVVLFLVGEVGNLSNHITLRNLRSSGGTERGIPRGLGFDLVTCPNYMFEAIAWVGIALISWSLSTVIFATAAIGQMAVWANKKESKYRREFGGKYQTKRYTMIPGVW